MNSQAVSEKYEEQKPEKVRNLKLVDQNYEIPQIRNKQHYHPRAAKPIRIPRNMFSLTHYYIIYMIIAVACVKFSLEIPELMLEINFFVLSKEFVFKFPLLVILMLPVLFKVLSIIYDSRKEIRFNHLRYVSGILSPQRKEIEIPYEDISFVNVTQNLWERLFNIGTLAVGTSGSQRPEIVFSGIDSPHKYANLLYKRISKARMMQRHQHAHQMPLANF